MKRAVSVDFALAVAVAPKPSAADQVAGWARRKGPKRKRSLVTLGRLQSIISELADNNRRDDGEIRTETPTDLVNLYAWLHDEIYGCEPTELVGVVYQHATFAAAKLIKDLGNVDAAVAYMRWVWIREKGREDWRRKNPNGGGRITWHEMFIGRRMLTDYRVEMNRGSRRA